MIDITQAKTENTIFNKTSVILQTHHEHYIFTTDRYLYTPHYKSIWCNLHRFVTIWCGYNISLLYTLSGCIYIARRYILCVTSVKLFHLDSRSTEEMICQIYFAVCIQTHTLERSALSPPLPRYTVHGPRCALQVSGLYHDRTWWGKQAAQHVFLSSPVPYQQVGWLGKGASRVVSCLLTPVLKGRGGGGCLPPCLSVSLSGCVASVSAFAFVSVVHTWKFVPKTAPFVCKLILW